MTEQDIITQTGYFLWENLWGILFVVIIFMTIMSYIILNNIKFEKQKTRVEKVLVLEKMANPPPNSNQLDQDVENASSNNGTCGQLNDKAGCTSLGSCVWVTANYKGKINKCVAAQALGSGSQKARGSDGPTDMCYCNKDGKLIPWEEYYYLDGSEIKKKPGKDCTARGDKCTYKN